MTCLTVPKGGHECMYIETNTDGIGFNVIFDKSTLEL